MNLCFSAVVEHSHCPLLSVSVAPSVRPFDTLGVDPQALLELAVTSVTPFSNCMRMYQCFSSCQSCLDQQSPFHNYFPYWPQTNWPKDLNTTEDSRHSSFPVVGGRSKLDEDMAPCP